MWDNKIYGATCFYKTFSEKRWNFNWTNNFAVLSKVDDFATYKKVEVHAKNSTSKKVEVVSKFSTF